MENARKFLVFSLGQRESYAIDIAEVIEIRELVTAVPAPKMEPFVKGFASFRGTVVTIADLAKRFGIESPNPTRTIVVVINDNIVGLDVTKVESIIELQNNDELVEYSSLLFNADTCITHVIKRGKDNSLISVVNLDKVFT